MTSMNATLMSVAHTMATRTRLSTALSVCHGPALRRLSNSQNCVLLATYYASRLLRAAPQLRQAGSNCRNVARDRQKPFCYARTRPDAPVMPQDCPVRMCAHPPPELVCCCISLVRMTTNVVGTR